MKRQFAGSVLGLGLTLSIMHGAAADEHAPIAAPQVAVGDSWTYQYTDVWKKLPGNLNRMEVTAVDDSGIQVDIKRAASGALVSKQRFSRELNPVDRGRMHFDPAFQRYAFPLEPGKEWSSDATGENTSQGKRWRYRFKGKALGWEKVKVPAGEFDAMKIEVTGYYHGEQVGTNGGSGQLNETLWFAPAVNNFVKLEYQDTDWQGHVYNRDQWELTAYQHK